MSHPRLCVVGLSHKTAPLTVREQVAFNDAELDALLKRLQESPGVGEVMLVSTCNRVELYAGVDGADAGETVRNVLRGARPGVDLEPHLYVLDGEAALRHLMRVASSLDSLVVGEPQILGQVKAAFARARQAGTVGPLLSRAVPRAFQVAKRVRSETDVAKNAASMASVAVDLAKQIFGDLGRRGGLVLGAGKMSELSARHLKSAGVNELYIVNRTPARAVELAARLGGVAAGMEELDRLLARVDIVLCSTGATEPLIRAERVERAMRARRGRWLFFIDIAVPRDVEPEVARLENVYLYDADALATVVAANRAGRSHEAAAAERLVDEEVMRLTSEARTQDVVPVIKALRQRFLTVAEAEVERAAGKLAGASDRAFVVQLVHSVVNKLLHQPLTALKREAAGESDELALAVCALFELELELELGSSSERPREPQPPAQPGPAAVLRSVKSGDNSGER